MRALKAAGANVSVPESNGQRPVYVAACHGHAKAIAALRSTPSLFGLRLIGLIGKQVKRNIYAAKY
ncbi:MAG TPA: hypothetical protein PK583_03830 [Gammaproteobacteria bacterium]|nr:hypothetical protein [Gammaproteobacteria bacterium]